MVKELREVLIGDRIPIIGDTPVYVVDKITDMTLPSDSSDRVCVYLSNGLEVRGRDATTLTVFPLDCTESGTLREWDAVGLDGCTMGGDNRG